MRCFSWTKLLLLFLLVFDDITIDKIVTKWQGALTGRTCREHNHSFVQIQRHLPTLFLLIRCLINIVTVLIRHEQSGVAIVIRNRISLFVIYSSHLAIYVRAYNFTSHPLNTRPIFIHLPSFHCHTLFFIVAHSIVLASCTTPIFTRFTRCKTSYTF